MSPVSPVFHTEVTVIENRINQPSNQKAWITVKLMESVFITIIATFYSSIYRRKTMAVFSVDLVFKEELNLMLKVSDF